jgi:PKD repeat protein
MYNKFILLFVSFFVLLGSSYSQCFQVLDGGGALSSSPVFVSCTPGTFTVFIQTDQTIGPYIIDWGDGTANSNGASLVPPALEQHTYAATTDTFNLIITNSADGCVVTGKVVLERNPLASIQLPTGDDNFGCTPVLFRFINSSTQVSQTTTFTWDFGDGTATETYNYTNQNAIVTHTYLPGIGVQSCDLEVRLTATNNCGSSTASFFPLRVWDLDEAAITPSATLLCFPETTVSYTNNTTRNCYAEGNQTQRFEYWNFGDYWGLGYDSIINWRPWNPPIINPAPLSYPGIGSYDVMLIDSSFCGKDTAFQTIVITPPPTALLSANKDTICEGESVTFMNNTVGAANQFFWDFDLGSGFQNRNGNNKTRTYNVSGNYTISLVVGINGATGCTDTASVDLYVNPSPTASFTFTPDNQCDSATVTFTNTSAGNIVNWDWNFGNGNTFNGQNPPAEFYGTAGTYSVFLEVTNNQGCIDSVRNSVRIREVPVADFSVTSVCLNQLAQFNDLTVATVDPITNYKWYFGDGDSSSSQNPTHLYTGFGTFQVVQIVDNGFCQDSDTLVVVVENNPTADFNPDVSSGCSRLTVNFTNQSSVNATNFIWDFGDGSQTISARDTFHTFSNTGLQDTSFIVQMIAQTTFGCADTTFDTITVFPVPTPSFTSDAIVNCGPVSVNFTNTTVGNGLSFFWDFDDGTALVSDTNPSHTFENKTFFINNYNVKLIVESTNGCRDTTIQIVTVYPEPIFTFQVVPDSGCSPLRVSFPSVIGAVNYSWDFGDGTTGSGATPVHTFINNSTNDLILNVRLIAQNSFGCLDTSFGTVLVYPSPISEFSIDTNIGCQPLPIQITNNSIGANNFNWSFGDGTNSTSSTAVFTKTYTNTSALTNVNTIQLITSTSNGCADTTQKTLQVYPFVNAKYASDSIGCSPFDVGFINQSVGSALFDWRFGDGDTSIGLNANHIYNNTSNSNQTFESKLIVTSPQGCIDSASRNIIVYAKPIADFSLSDSIGCHPVQVILTNNSTNADNCNWSYGDGNVLSSCFASNTHIYSNTTSFFPINYISQLVVSTNNGCKDTLQKTVTVNPEVQANFNSANAGCSPYPVSFQNQSIGGQSYTWDFGDGDSSLNSSPSHLFVNDSLRDTTFQVKLLIESQYNCVDSVFSTVQVFAKPIANFSLDTNRGCHPVQVMFSDNSSIKDSCFWVFGDGNVIDTCFTNLSKTYTNTQSSIPVNFNAQLFVFTNNGCRDTSNRVITVNPEIQASFTSITSGCTPLNVAFQDQSTGVNNYDWTFGDGGSSISSSPNHTFINQSLNDTIFTTKQLVENSYGCQDSISQSITVFAKPIADFSLDTNRGCNPVQIMFSDNSLIKDSCRWVFGDGNIIDTCFFNATKIYTNTQSSIPVNFNAQLFVFTNNGCRDTSNRIITVNPEIQANFNSIISGCTPLDISFQDQSTGVNNYDWTFGDGGSSISSGPNHTFFNPSLNDTTYLTKLLVENNYGCQDSLDQIITVFSKPIADYSVDINGGCQPLPVNFTNQSAISDNCYWSYDDGFTDTTCNSVNHTYLNSFSLVPVNYDSRLIVETNNGCRDTLSRTISVNPAVIAGIAADTLGCSPLSNTLRSQSFGAISYAWNFGDGGAANGLITSHTFYNTGAADSIYSVQLIASSLYGCDDTTYQNVVVQPTPIPNFVATPGFQVYPNSTLNFVNSTNQGNWNFAWDFGDTTTSTLRTPSSHTYGTWGVYEIELKAFTATCSDSISKFITIDVPIPVVSFSDSASGCTPLEVAFTNTSLYGDQFDWDFGDGRGSSTAENPIYTYQTPGIYDVSLTVRGVSPQRKQANLTKTDYIRVFKSPEAGFFTNKETVFIPTDPLVLSNFSNNSDSYVWNFGDGNVSTDESPVYYYQEEGEFRIELIALSNNGCSDTAFAPNLVFAKLEGSIKIPNAFTPNPNGSSGGLINPLTLNDISTLNDVFYAKVAGTVAYELSIFNKWGELLFISKDPQVGWDGYYKGELSKQDAYVWKIIAEFADGRTVVKTGDLLLLR